MVEFVILCGGSGSRLWPKSREKMPKQFIRITNTYTMFQNTLIRINKLIKIDKDNNSNNKVIVICNQDHIHLAQHQITELNLDINIIILGEPKGRDSAPAICISSLIGSNENCTMIMPCDHVIDDDEFIKVYLSSLKYLNNSIVTFGIKPTYAETGYGYIKTDNNFETIQFVEKPNKETANEYLKGNYLWNAGIFLFKNKNMIKCFEKYEPEILQKCREIIDKADITKSLILLDSLFFECRSISIDYAIMEPLCKDTTNFIEKKTIPYNGHWNDIGSFSSLYDELDKDENNNIISGDIKIIKTTNCYIESEDRLISTIGVNNLIIIDTLDALLICNKDHTQDVKKIVDYLKETKREEAYLHKTVIRPWGFYKNIEGNDINGFKVKKIVVLPGKRLSLQSHNLRSEHWVIVKGSAKVTLGREIFYLNKDDYIYIPIKTLHRIENVGESLLEFTETQVGDYLGEDDIIRYQDDFGRL